MAARHAVRGVVCQERGGMAGRIVFSISYVFCLCHELTAPTMPIPNVVSTTDPGSTSLALVGYATPCQQSDAATGMCDRARPMPSTPWTMEPDG